MTELNPSAVYRKSNLLPSLGQILSLSWLCRQKEFSATRHCWSLPSAVPRRAPRFNLPPLNITFFSHVFFSHVWFSHSNCAYFPMLLLKFILIGLDLGESKRHYCAIFRLSFQFHVLVINEGEFWSPPSPRAQAKIATIGYVGEDSKYPL